MDRMCLKVLLHVNFNIEKFHPFEMHSVYNYKRSRGQFLSDSDFNSSRQAFPKVLICKPCGFAFRAVALRRNKIFTRVAD